MKKLNSPQKLEKHKKVTLTKIDENAKKGRSRRFFIYVYVFEIRYLQITYLQIHNTITKYQIRLSVT